MTATGGKHRRRRADDEHARIADYARATADAYPDLDPEAVADIAALINASNDHPLPAGGSPEGNGSVASQSGTGDTSRRGGTP